MAATITPIIDYDSSFFLFSPLIMTVIARPFFLTVFFRVTRALRPRRDRGTTHLNSQSTLISQRLFSGLTRRLVLIYISSVKLSNTLSEGCLGTGYMIEKDGLELKC